MHVVQDLYDEGMQVYSACGHQRGGGSGTLLNRCRLHKTKKHTHCSVTDLCSSTKQVYLGVITTDGCKNDRFITGLCTRSV